MSLFSRIQSASVNVEPQVGREEASSNNHALESQEFAMHTGKIFNNTWFVESGTANPLAEDSGTTTWQLEV